MDPAVQVNVPVPLFVSTPEAFAAGKEYVAPLILTVAPAIVNADVGLVVPIPRFPEKYALFAIGNAVVGSEPNATEPLTSNLLTGEDVPIPKVILKSATQFFKVLFVCHTFRELLYFAQYNIVLYKRQTIFPYRLRSFAHKFLNYCIFVW